MSQLEAPQVGLDRLLAELSPVATEPVELAQAGGRVLGASISADRDSPPFDASAMDGFAMRVDDLSRLARLPIASEALIGQIPAPLREGFASRISTGSPLPPGADTVVRIEDLEVAAESVSLRPSAGPPSVGQHIRRRGENLAAGSEVLAAGELLHAGAIASLAAFHAGSCTVRRRVRVAVLITGNEVRHDLPPDAHSIRDSNGPAIRAAASALSWVDLVEITHVGDDLEQTTAEMTRLLNSCDALITTGGVSMGQHDHVPSAAQRAGGRMIYHRLAMRPGKPNFAAVTPSGQPILSLPGNPVSVLCGWCRLVRPCLQALAGITQTAASPTLEVANPDGKTLDLWWYRLGHIDPAGRFTLQPSRGSGDMASAGPATGFIEQPPRNPGHHGRYLAF